MRACEKNHSKNQFGHCRSYAVERAPDRGMGNIEIRLRLLRFFLPTHMFLEFARIKKLNFSQLRCRVQEFWQLVSVHWYIAVIPRVCAEYTNAHFS